MVAPEWKVLGFVVAVLALAYFVVYPRMEPKSLRRMMRADLVISTVILVTVGSVYFGTGIRFSLLFISTNWWVFTLVATIALECPLFFWFCRKWGISLRGDDDTL